MHFGKVTRLSCHNGAVVFDFYRQMEELHVDQQDEAMDLEQLEDRLEMESAGALAESLLPIECWCNKNN